MRILLLDDNVRDMAMFCEAVRAYGHEVTHVSNPDEVEEILGSEPFDAVILDLMFPPIGVLDDPEAESGYLGGVVLYERFVHRHLEGKPLLVLTGVEEVTELSDRAEEALSQFAELKGVLRKPAEIEKILKMLEGIEAEEKLK